MGYERRETSRTVLRRVAWVTLLAFLAGTVFYLRTDVLIHGVPVPILTGLAYAAVVGPTTLAICIFWPAVSTLVECIAVSRLVVSGFVFAFPDAGNRLLANPAILACLVILGALILRRIARDNPHLTFVPALVR